MSFTVEGVTQSDIDNQALAWFKQKKRELTAAGKTIDAKKLALEFARKMKDRYGDTVFLKDEKVNA